MLLESLMIYFADTLDVVRKPSEAAGGNKPLMILDPRDGVPPPDVGAATGSDAVIGVLQTGGIPARPRENFLRQDVVDFWLRTKTSARARELEEGTIRPNLIDKVEWTMGGMLIHEVLQWRPLQRFSSDQDGYTFHTAYIFERRAT